MNKFAVAVLLVAAFAGYVAANRIGNEFEEDVEFDSHFGEELHDDELDFAGHHRQVGQHGGSGFEGHHSGSNGFNGHHGDLFLPHGHRHGHHGHYPICGEYGVHEDECYEYPRHHGHHGKHGKHGLKHGHHGGKHGNHVFRHGHHGGKNVGFGPHGHRHGHQGHKHRHNLGEFGQHGRSGHQGGKFKNGGLGLGGLRTGSVGAVGGSSNFGGHERDQHSKAGLLAENKHNGVGELDLDVSDIQKGSKHTHFNKDNTVVSNHESGGEDVDNIRLTNGHLNEAGAVSNKNKLIANREDGRHESDANADISAGAIGASGTEIGGF